jgi:hypothetical protein
LSARLGDGGEYRRRDRGMIVMGEGATRRSRSEEGVEGRELPFIRGGVGCRLTVVTGLTDPIDWWASKPELQD